MRLNRFVFPGGVFALLCLCAVLSLPACSKSERPSGDASPSVQAAYAKGRVTFLELGGVGCKPCDAMVPVLEEIKRRYAGRVDVEFHDVRKNPDAAMKWRVVIIPTQVFLDGQGKEFFRHEGFLPLEEVEAVLRKGGVK